MKTALERFPWAEQHIKPERTEAYTKHGCNIRGNLVVMDCGEANRAHPQSGVFASQSCLDVLDVAREIAARDYPGATEMLAVPDLVIRLPAHPAGA